MATSNTALDPLSQLEQELDVSVVIPCLNEAETIAICVTKAKRSLDEAGLSGEVIVADNGSDDGSAADRRGRRRARGRRSASAATATPTTPASPPRAAATS